MDANERIERLRAALKNILAMWDEYPSAKAVAQAALDADDAAMEPCGECHLQLNEICDICGKQNRPRQCLGR